MNALKKGDAAKLATFFDDNVDLAILDDEDMYSKAEAQKKVAAFFSSHKPAAFEQVHKGTSKGAGSHYVIGDLKAGGTTYRVYIHLEETKDSYIIQELRIEE
jgi:hypothetical protein